MQTATRQVLIYFQKNILKTFSNTIKKHMDMNQEN